MVLGGVDCDSQVLNRPWRNVRYTSSRHPPEIIFKTTQGQIEPGKTRSQQGGLSRCIQGKIGHLTIDAADKYIFFFHSVL